MLLIYLYLGLIWVIVLLLALCRPDDSDAKKEMGLHIKHLKDVNPKK